jgi:hypothetical protein
MQSIPKAGVTVFSSWANRDAQLDRSRSPFRVASPSPSIAIASGSGRGCVSASTGRRQGAPSHDPARTLDQPPSLRACSRGPLGAAPALGIGRRIFDVQVWRDGKRSGTRGGDVPVVSLDDSGAASKATRMPVG